MCPDCGGVRHRGTNHGGIDPFCNALPWTPVPPGGREEGVKEALCLGRLGHHVVMPPQAPVECQAQVFGRKTVGHGLARDSEWSGGKSPCPGEEDNLCFGRIKDKATVRAPGHKAIDCKLYLLRRTAGSEPLLRMAQSSAKATPRVGPSLISWTAWSKARDQKVAKQTPPWGNPIPVVRDVL